MVTLIDTSVAIAIERGQLTLGQGRLPAGDLYALSAVTAAELLHGVHRAEDAGTRSRREAFVETTLARLPVLPFNLDTARIHARIWADLARQGVSIGAYDLLIAATALSVGGRVATRDLRSFPRIPGLEILAC
ncbi:MAG: PIN domain-containing protein [Acidobacteria bacterium]|nr:PIN domain-containing protein [Acidobacteriota bacterium]